MSFASSYLQKHSFFRPFIPDEPGENTSIIVVIPCFNEPAVLDSLVSLYNAHKPSLPVEVIVAVNSPEGTGRMNREQNKKTIVQVQKWSSIHSGQNFKVHVIDVPPFPAKHAGAGFARKVGMDEAVHRFNMLNNDRGIIVSFDADSVCDNNYFTELERCFSRPEIKGCTVYFEHPLPGENNSCSVNPAIILYEIYLRYFIQAMRLAGFPWSFHTIGSCFAVKSLIYARQGGMNRKKAGEDFYFLHKLFSLGNFTELNTTRVIPSSRISDRVAFGTGATIKKIAGSSQGQLLTYPPESFEELEAVFTSVPDFYRSTDQDIARLTERFPGFMRDYLFKTGFAGAVREANKHSAGIRTFRKRFFIWFNALRLLQYLNFAHNNGRPNLPVAEAAKMLLERSGITPESNNKNLLLQYRMLQRKVVWKC